MNKLIISVSALLKAMQQNKKGINSKTPLPVCEMYLMNVKAGTWSVNGANLQIVTTDLETSVLNSIACEAMETFSFLMPGDVVKYLSKLEDQPLTISVNVKNSEIQIQTEDGKCKYVGGDAGEFPVIPSVNVSAQIDISLIGSFMGYCGKDISRPVMTGVNISNGDKGLRLCATDAHRLKIAEVSGTGIVESVIVPFAAVKILNDFNAGVCQYGFNAKDNYLRFDINERLTVICRAIDGRFPNFDAVIPEDKSQTTFLTAPRKELISTIDKASLFCNETTNMVRFNMNGETKVSAEDVDFQKEICLVRKWDKKGNDLEISVNHKFMNAILKDIQTETVVLEMSLPNRAITITQGPVKWLTLPVMNTRG